MDGDRDAVRVKNRPDVATRVRGAPQKFSGKGFGENLFSKRDFSQDLKVLFDGAEDGAGG